METTLVFVTIQVIMDKIGTRISSVRVWTILAYMHRPVVSYPFSK